MTATAHALVAGAIATTFPDPFTAGTLAFLSHFVMDSIPHWDIGTNWRGRPRRITGALAIAETAVGISAGFLFFSSRAPTLTLLLAIALSLLPDWMETPWYIFFARQNKPKPGKNAGAWERLTYGIYKTENMFHAKLQDPLLGIATQVIAVVFFLQLLEIF